MSDLHLTIESVAFGGKGLARHEGKVWFVPDTVPGDEITAQITSDSGRYGDAKMVDLLRPSDLRTPARCAYIDACGGCQWMGIAYTEQLQWKKQFVTSSLQRIGRLNKQLDISILPSPIQYNYRNRVLLRLHIDASGRLQLGYFKRSSRELVPIKRCEIAAEPINRLIEQVYALDLRGLADLRARLEIQEAATAEKLVLTVFPGDGHIPAGREQAEKLAQLLKALPEVIWAGVVFDLPQAPVVLHDENLNLQFLTLPGQFQQVNIPHNHTLRRLVLEHVRTLDSQSYQHRLLDVFCGSGNLSLPLADGRRYIEGIESDKKAIAVARKNVDANLLSNTNYIAGDAESHLWKCSKKAEIFDLVILDPPRQGMYQGMIPLKNLAPKNIIYVSCDPSTLARDLGSLTKNEQYKLDKVVCLDFFPHTYHVETVAFLSLTDNR